MKIVTVIGARPQFIKASVVSKIIRERFSPAIQEILVHTGQHYDHNMSGIFFQDLGLPSPNYALGISGGNHGAMTGRMIEAIESVLLKENPDWVLVYGDTNSTLAGALAAIKLRIPIAHVEAGLRSFNMGMPEEVNRILTDRISSLLFCPTDSAVANLSMEGLTCGVHNVGDVMFDAARLYGDLAKTRSTAIRDLGLSVDHYVLATCHRAENTDNPKRLNEIFSALAEIATQIPVVLPLHPRTEGFIDQYNLGHHLRPLVVTPPLPYLDMVALEQGAKVIFTDSGGLQKEAFFYSIPCVTMRDETEWVETVELGWNMLTGANREEIVTAFMTSLSANKRQYALPYGDGQSGARIVEFMLGN